MPTFKPAAEFGAQLLAELGVRLDVSGEADHPALAWRRAGLSPLTGPADGKPQVPPVPLATAADGAILALRAVADHPEKLPLNGSLLLGERARLMGLQRAGRQSAGGHCRLLDASDGRIALNLAREDDWGLLEAWLEHPVISWDEIERLVEGKSVSDLVARGIELGLPIALDALRDTGAWFEQIRFHSVGHQSGKPLVVDLSGLWAGPLAGNLLHLMGADVIKVESVARPDGARQGNREFFQLLNAGKKSVALDFASRQGRRDLMKLIASADIVIEASRPRALQQLGIDAERLTAEKAGKLWVRLTAHGARENRIGFGDDIGVAAGLSTIMDRAWGAPCFVGDAIADPVSGIYAALAAWIKWQQGGGCLLNLSMGDIVRHAMQIENHHRDWSGIASHWQHIADADDGGLYPMRSPAGLAEDMGKSSLQILSGPC